MNQYYVYILLCENGAYYTGYTSDLNRRLKEHEQGSGKCKFTRSFRPICLVQHWLIQGDKKAAMRVERLIKKLAREEKDHLIANPHLLDTKSLIINFCQ
jgi:putative endonuclease